MEHRKRVAERKEKNRLAAKKCREKKDDQIRKLEQVATTLPLYSPIEQSFKIR